MLENCLIDKSTMKVYNLQPVAGSDACGQCELMYKCEDIEISCYGLQDGYPIVWKEMKLSH